jgi:hypothetical protein
MVWRGGLGKLKRGVVYGYGQQSVGSSQMEVDATNGAGFLGIEITKIGIGPIWSSGALGWDYGEWDQIFCIDQPWFGKPRIRLLMDKFYLGLQLRTKG